MPSIDFETYNGQVASGPSPPLTNFSSGSIYSSLAPPPLPLPTSTSPHWTTLYEPSALSSEQWTHAFGSVPLPSSPEEMYVTPNWKNKMKDSELFYNKELKAVVAFRNGIHSGEIGIEIECEGTDLFTIPFKWWTCHEDGSLRETHGHKPVEYVLRVPLSVEKAREALVYLDSKLKETKSKVINSQRTSVHIHVNCQKMTIRQLYCYICLYMIFEEILVDWSGPERAGNLFCLRAKDSEFYVGMLENVLKNNSLKNWRDEYRYSACNVASINKFGSLEFRSMQGTVDIQLIQLWIDILVLLKEQALTYDNPIDIVDEFTSIGPLPFFKKIFKDKKLRQLFESVPGLSGKLWDGLRLMRDIAHCCEWKPPIKKKQTPKKKPKTKT